MRFRLSLLSSFTLFYPLLETPSLVYESIDPVLKKVVVSIGLDERQQMYRVLIPLAMPAILSGIKTAAVISIGTATLAAFIGAGGLGEPIVTGLALNDVNLILQSYPGGNSSYFGRIFVQFIGALDFKTTHASGAYLKLKLASVWLDPLSCLEIITKRTRHRGLHH